MSYETTVLSKQHIDAATQAVNDYVATATTLYGELVDLINKLRATDFIGDASNGFEVFFTQSVTPALTTNLTDPTGSLTYTVKNLLNDVIYANLNGHVDPELGKGNESAGK